MAGKLTASFVIREVNKALKEINKTHQKVTPYDIFEAIEWNLTKMCLAITSGNAPKAAYETFKRYRLDEIAKAIVVARELKEQARDDGTGDTGRSAISVEGRCADRVAEILSAAIKEGAASRTT